MIIGIHGKKGHGKDLLAKIINILVAETDQGTRFVGGVEGGLKYYDDGIMPRRESDRIIIGRYWKFEKKMFAYKLKLYVCSLIGCTMEQLEDQDFKERPLGPEWDKWYIHNETYCLSRGLFTTEVEARLAYERIKDPRYTNAQELHSWWSPLGDIKIDFRRYIMTPRLMLQLAGTEGGRNTLHPNMWVNALFVDYDNVPVVHGKPNWIVTDVRFKNECQAIKDRGGKLFKIFRPGMNDSSTHESETALDNVPDSQWDGLILNNGISDFVNVIAEQAKILLHTHKII